MPGINIDFDDADYSTIRDVAAGSGLPIKTFARLAVMSATAPASPQWTLVTTTAEEIPELSSGALDVMTLRRGTDVGGSWRENACLWAHLTERALIVAYPSQHGTKDGHYEFLIDTMALSGVPLDAWDDPNLNWRGDTTSTGQKTARAAAVILGNRRLGITSSPAFAGTTTNAQRSAETAVSGLTVEGL